MLYLGFILIELFEFDVILSFFRGEQLMHSGRALTVDVCA